MAVGEALAWLPESNGGGRDRPKSPRFDRCFSGLEFKMDSGPLKDLDAEKMKNEIRRWAKAVVAYARQLSGRLSGS